MRALHVRKEGALYSIMEEIANAITHGIGAALAIAGCIILIVFAAFTGDAWKIVSASIYGASMIILFTMSTLYHSFTHTTAKKVFRIFDHTSIYLLIAGTYTPFTLVLLRGALGWTIFGVVWAAAVLGIVLNSISIERFKKFSMICYLASGWCIIVAIVPMVRALGTAGTVFLLLGGVMYTAGVLFYKKKEIQYMHSIWHVFVLAGAIFHFFCVLMYVIIPR